MTSHRPETAGADWLRKVIGGKLPAEETLMRRDLLQRTALHELLSMFEGMPGSAGAERRIAAYGDWIAANPTSPQLAAAWFNLGTEYGSLGNRASAMAAYQQALALQPGFHPAAVNLGLAFEALGQPEAALACWGNALQPDTALTALLNSRGRLLETMSRLKEAEHALFRSLAADPAQPDVIHHWLHLRQKTCAWPIIPEGLPGLPPARLLAQSGPLGALALTDDPALQRDIAADWVARKVPAAPYRLSPEAGYEHTKIRLGYLSSDFCSHAMSYLIAEVLERHDRTAFEVFGYCSSPEDGSDIRRRIIAALDCHILARGMDDATLARRIHADEIDILIDLNGLTSGARLHTLRWKPAPVQVTYLGYIGSVPLPELDYLICDNFVIPSELQGHYLPQPLPLDTVYQANDSRRVDLPTASRLAEGLPEDAFVLCCFCPPYKITATLFAAWMEILDRVKGAVLWLVCEDPAARRNLQERAAESGIAVSRIIFARRVEPALYLARFALADLFLDTTPYNAGTVASDALRMGLPLLTLSQRAFASRMAGSLLRAVGLGELVTESVSAYIETACSLATDPARLSRLRTVLADDAWTRALGDGARFTIGLEAAYRRIHLRPS